MSDLLTDSTWTCHVCGRTRSDEKINVATHSRINGAGVRTEQNVRYCNDSDTCRTSAMLRDHLALAEIRTATAYDKLKKRVDRMGPRVVRGLIACAANGFLAGFILGAIFL